MNPYPSADLRSSIHHHRHNQSRYASSPSPPPVHRANFSNNSKAYAPQTLNHQHRHLQPNVHYPSQPPYQSSPSVTSAIPSPRPQLDYTARGLNSVDDEPGRRSLYHHNSHNHSHHHHHHHRIVDCDHRGPGGYDSSYMENRSELPVRHEILTDNRVKRPFSHVDSDPDMHLHTVERGSISPFLPVDSFRHDSDSVPRGRAREDYAEGFESSHEHEDFTRGHFRRFASSAGRYNDDRRELYGETDFHKNNRRDHLTEKQSWIYSEEGSGDLVNSFSGMTYEVADGKDFGTVTENQAYHGSESGRYNRGGREGVREYNLTPRKQIQKRSAFLRLQMPKSNYRNRDNEHHHSSTYHDANEPASLKGKGQFAGVDNVTKDRREGGSVELDVSFKSNTLIAKAIVPSTSSRLDDQDLAPRNKKLKSTIVSGRDSKSSSPNKVKETLEKSNGSPAMANSAISTSKDSRESEGKVIASAVEKVSLEGQGVKGQGAKSASHIKEDTNSLKSSKETHIKQEEDKLIRSNVCSVLDKGGLDANSNKNKVSGLDANPNKDKAPVKQVVGNDSGKKVILRKDGASTGCSEGAILLAEAGNKVVSGKNPSVQVAKKKKVVRKVVKRVVTSRSDKLSGQPIKKHVPAAMPAASGTEKVACSSKEKVACKEEALSASGTEKVTGSSEETVACKEDALLHNPVEKYDSTSADLLPQIDKGPEALDPISTNDCSKGVHQKLTSSLNDKGEKDGCSPPQSRFCEGLISNSAYDKNIVNIHNVSSSTEYPTALLGETLAKTSRENSNRQMSQDVDCSLLKNNVVKESYYSDDQDIPCQLVLGESNVHKASSVSSPGTDWVVSHSQERASDSEKECIDAVERKPFSNRTSAVLSVASAQASQKSVTGWASDVSSSTSKESFSKNEAIDHRVQSCEVGAIRKRGYKVSSINVNSEEGLKKIAENDGKDGDVISQVGILNSTAAHICIDPVNVSCCNPPKSVDQTIELSVKDPDPPAEDFTGGLPVLRLVRSVSNGSGSSNEFSEVGGSDLGDFLKSPSTLKRRKVSFPCMEFPRVRTSQNNDMALVTDKLSSLTELQLISHDYEIESEEGLAISSMHTSTGTVGSLSCRQESCISHEDCQIAGLSSAIPDRSVHDCLNPGIGSNLNFGESDIASVESLNQLFSEGQLEEGYTVVNPMNDNQKWVPSPECSEELKVKVNPSEDTAMLEVEKPHASTEERHICDMNLLSPMADNDSGLQSKEELPFVSTDWSLSVDEGGIDTSNLDDAVMEYVPDSLSEMGFPESLSNLLDAQISNCKASSLNQLCSNGIGENDNKVLEDPVVKEHLSISPDSALMSVLPNAKAGKSSNFNTEANGKETNKAAVLSSRKSKNIKGTLNPTSAELYGRRNQPGQVIRRTVSGDSSFLSGNSKANSVNSTAKPNTWHRTSNPAASVSGDKTFLGSVLAKRQISASPDTLQKTSYIRKGNSLVRKTGSAAAAQPPLLHGSNQSVQRLKSPDLSDPKKSTDSINGDDDDNLLNLARAGVTIATSVRPQTPPVSNSSNLQYCNTVFSACSPSPEAVDVVVTSLGNPTSDPMEPHNVPKSHEDGLKLSETDQGQDVPPTSLLSRNEVDDENVVNCNVKKITYVKRKSNQLVATLNDSEIPSQIADQTQTLGCDGYYKSKKNQLIRTSADGMGQPTGYAINAQASTSQVFGRKKSQKAAARAGKPSKSSLVWTLHSSLLSKSNSDAIYHQKAFPHLFPWKRPTYRRNLVLRRTRDKSSSAISSRLTLLRRRDTVYVRSFHGLSLRKAKVVSVGGSNLKWSKSIERRSKKANEEATRAVAAADKEKREHNGASSVGSGTKNKNHSLRERIFRIGSFRYKMDSSRRTLIRISDESSHSAASQSGMVEKNSYVPRRLVIGNEEYVRIGNGNKLIRDPKKLTRVLASEKVRWSLHTVRLRLAKKQKFCQFFTRFGQCNKGNGKCPYIHDPSKIAVCTKFLSGSCSNEDCKLTHKVIPERMPDCSYFLQGLCTNRNCPYRHVNVNPKSSTCEGFLKGYCADGDECRKKHTYVCPSFEATGSCPEGSKCKLHHPKPRTKKGGKKRKRSTTAEGKKKNSSGRYFGGSKRVALSEPGKAAIISENGTSFDGEIGDYISIDVTDEEEPDEEREEDQHNKMDDDDDDDDAVDVRRHSDLDELIKPIKIMNMV